MQSILFIFLKRLTSLASSLGQSKKLLILIYHRVLDEPDFMRPSEVDRQAFAWQMALMARYFNVLPLTEALAKLQTNTLPTRAVAITFDDGYADNLRNAVPVLRQYGLTATFFIASGYLNGGRMWNDSVIEAVKSMPGPDLDLTEISLGRYDIATPSQKLAAAEQIIGKIKHLDVQQRLEYSRYIAARGRDLPDDLMLTSQQLVELSESGMEIGGHTVTHPILSKLTDADAAVEIMENKGYLQRLLGAELSFFAYPNGKPGQDYLPSQQELVKACGYKAAFSTVWGVADSQSDCWQLPRFTPWDKTPVRFMLRIIARYFHALFEGLGRIYKAKYSV